MNNLENDPFVEEIFKLAQTEEVERMAKECIEEFKRNYKPIEIKKAEIFNVLNASYIAKRFFGKSRNWLYQKLNHNIKNGKEAKFTAEEYLKLKEAIETIAEELQTLAEDM
ncbi:MAG: DUF5053 domain-containing protein [Bacteroides sp.]|nr:DUF5053 domain-containing protein [Bacteroides sp.]